MKESLLPSQGQELRLAISPSWERPNVSFYFPDGSSDSIAKQLFYRVYEIPIQFVDRPKFTVDVYASRAAISPEIHPFLKGLVGGIADFQRKKIDLKFSRRLFTDSFMRMVRTGERGSEETQEAVRVFWESVAAGGSVAFIAAHGGPDHRTDTTERRILQEFSQVSESLPNIANDVASFMTESGNLEYKIIYFNSCAPTVNHDDLKTSIPVIYHTEDNNGITDTAPARVYIPLN